MTTAAPAVQSKPSYHQGLLLVFMAGVCWSTMGLMVRLMGDVGPWQILLYRSGSLAVFLFLVARFGNGSVSDVAFLLSIVAGLATIGWTIAGGVDVFEARRRPERSAPKPGRCTVCGKVMDLVGDIDSAEIEGLRQEASGFTVTGYRLELTGYCPDCLPHGGQAPAPA